MNKHTKEDLAYLQSLPLNIKIQKTVAKITEWYIRFNGQVYISFSGGKDSTVLLHIARQIFSDIEAVFCDTGLEYPEIRAFVKTFDNVTWIKPKMRFDEVIKKFGYPVISKEVADCVSQVKINLINNVLYTYRAAILSGTATDKQGYLSQYNIPQWKFLLDAPFKISGKCCTVMKKQPFKKYEKQTGKKAIIATMTEESRLRKTKWLRYGCNAFDSKRQISNPMSFWTEQDVLHYIKNFNIPYASVYGDLIKITYGKLVMTGCQRTGCMFCMFGCHLEATPNRFQRMAKTHPKQYEYCIREENGLGCGKVLDFIGVDYKMVYDLFDYVSSQNLNASCDAKIIGGAE